MNKELFNKLKELSDRIEKMKENTITEEATKMSFILPFFQILGYDVFNPLEFVPEYTQDVGTKKGEKVDYAIMQNGSPIVIIEAKACNVILNNKHITQLFRYFTVSKARFAILTNGIIYRFYSDLDEPNKMDTNPFLEIDMLNLNEDIASKLYKFSKEHFNVKDILTNASVLKDYALIRNSLEEQIKNPSDAFVKAILKDVYSGVKTQAVMDRFRNIIKDCFTDYINDQIGSKNNIDVKSNEPMETVEKKEREFTDTEIQILEYIKSLISELSDNIVFKKTDNYVALQIGNNNRKWVCRVFIKQTEYNLLLHKFGKYETEYIFNDPTQLAQLKPLFSQIVKSCYES